MHVEIAEQPKQPMMTEIDIKNTLRQFILSDFMADLDPEMLTDEMSFEGAHLVDSVGMMDLILFVEETFEIDVENEEALPENFDSIANLVAYVTKKRSGQ